MKKIVSVLSVVLLLSVTACGGGKYGDVKDYVNDVIAAQEDYISAVENAGSADDVAKALTKFGDEVVKFAEQGEALKKKYPELDKWGKEPPAELKDVFEKLEKSSEKMGTAMSNPKLRKYMMDPKVMKAAMAMGQKFQKSKVFK